MTYFLNHTLDLRSKLNIHRRVQFTEAKRLDGPELCLGPFNRAAGLRDPYFHVVICCGLSL